MRAGAAGGGRAVHALDCHRRRSGRAVGAEAEALRRLHFAVFCELKARQRAPRRTPEDKQ